MAYRNYNLTNGFTVDKAGNGDFTSIGAAITAATAYIVNYPTPIPFITIGIRPGTYTENISMIANINLVALDGDAQNPNVKVVGSVSASYSGNANISNIYFQCNGSNIFILTGANATVLNVSSCYLNCTTNTGISSTGSNPAATINLTNCNGNLGTTGIAVFAGTNGSLNLSNTGFGNSGNSTTANTWSGSNGSINSSTISNPTTISGTAQFAFVNSNFITLPTGAIAINWNSTSSTNFMKACYINSGSGVGITVGAGATLNIFDCNMASASGAGGPIITGAGTVNYNVIETETNLAPTITSGIQTNQTFIGLEAIFTPTVSGVTVYSTQVGEYSRIGNVVTFSLHVIWTASSGGAMVIGGLPFTIRSADTSVGSIFIGAGVTFTAGNFLEAQAQSGTKTYQIFQYAGATATLSTVTTSATGNIQLSGSYLV